MSTVTRGGGVVVLILLASAFHARPAAAQSTMSDVISFLMTNQAVQTADFERDQAAAQAAAETIARALLINLTTVPIATSSSGFLYRLNPELGTVERATESFGAFFVERAITSGRGRASFGVSATTSGFEQLDGNNLRDQSFLMIANTFRDEPEPFDTEFLSLDLRTSTLTFFASVGITDRLEVGGAVPLVRLTLEGQRLNVYRGTPLVQATASGNASGLADVAIRAKYMLVGSRGGGVAAAGEVRLPTGDDENLLGAGSASWRLLAIGSVDQGTLSLHGNAGIVRGGVSDEFTFGGAASLAVRPRVTLSGEVVGRHVVDLRPVDWAAAPHPTIQGVDTLRLVPGDAGLTLVNALVGLKWNVTGTLVVGGHVGWPLTSRGLTAPFTPTVAFEYAF